MASNQKLIAAIVAGTGFENRAQRIRFFCKPDSRIRLRREPDNPYDANAIAVDMQCRILWGLYKPWVQIGYIKADRAKSLAPKIDSKTYIVQDAWVESVFAPRWMNHPRVSLRITVAASQQTNQKGSKT